jgi:hypothetical protein
MPVAPRSNKKGTKIAFDILGTPANLRKGQKKSVPEREDARLQYQDDALQK